MADEISKPCVEKTVLDIWQRNIGGARPALDDDYFMIGGQSLQLVRLFLAINEQFSVSYPVNTFYARPTARAMADFIVAQKSPPPPPPVKRKDG